MNKFVKRPMHSVKTPKEAVGAINPIAKFFSKFDSFMTPWGRYQYLRASMGPSSTGDEYSCRGDVAFEGIKNMQKVVDENILYDEDLKFLKDNIWEIL